MESFIMPLFISPDTIVSGMRDWCSEDDSEIVYTAEIIPGGRLKLEFEGHSFLLDNEKINEFYALNPTPCQLNDVLSDSEEPRIGLHPWGDGGDRLAVVSCKHGDDAYIIRPNSNEIIPVNYDAWYEKKKEALIGLLCDYDRDEELPQEEVHLFCCDTSFNGLDRTNLYKDLKNQVLDVVVKFGNFFKGSDYTVKLGLAIDDKGIIERLISQESNPS